jgi:hypothetical protein
MSDAASGFGEQIAESVEERIRAGAKDERCTGCAYRLGTDANSYGPTLVVAALCILDGDIFGCHMADKVCAGHRIMGGVLDEREAERWIP